jgi:nucleoside-diphosphate-sugar epimerase
MRTALIGCTGFVGTTLLRQTYFDDGYNSTNIEDIIGRHYDLVVCAGAPAVKWQANQQPQEDWANLQRLMNVLQQVTASSFVLISTVDVYDPPINVDEDTAIVPDNIHPYGKHRFLLEQFIQQQFAKHHIVRLPGLFGQGLKKNFIYDLMHTNCLHLTHCDSVFQFYDLTELWEHLMLVQKQAIPLINFATEPLSARELAACCFGLEFQNETERPPVRYDMHTKYAALVGRAGNYIRSTDETLSAIRRFVQQPSRSATI